MFNREEYNKRIEWYKEARFGLFLHFGVYAIPARGEWLRSDEQMSLEDYQPFVDEFDPDDCDLNEWAKCAKQAGMKYAVLTAKHHDGYCLFDTKLTDYKSDRDFVKEFLEAFRKVGIKVGLYYSLLDWHHEDFPHYQDRYHPMRNNEAYKGKVHHFDRYLDYMHGQIKELCTQYGQLDIMWFDFSYNEMTAKKWRAQELVEMVRQYQPNIILDNRLEASGEGFGSLVTDEPTDYSGDFVSPEQIIPPYGILDHQGRPVMWEACITMNDHWGYHSLDHNYKQPKTIIHKLVECVSKNGNMILNVGPNARGRFPKESIQILKEIGMWMDDYGQSIYGCGSSNLAKPDNGRLTQKGKTLYYHITEMSIGGIPLYGLNKEEIQSIRLLSDGSEVQIMDLWTVKNYPDIVFVNFEGKNKLPNEIDTVLEIKLK